MQETDSKIEKPPYLCAKCGSKRALKIQEHLFRFRPFVGWLALPFGMTIEYVWKAPIYLCQQCAGKLRKVRKISILPVVIGIILAVLFVYLTFVYLDYGFTFLILGLLSVVIGIVLYAVIYSSADPKAAVSRQSLILEIPGHGTFNYTENKEAIRVK